MQCSQPKGEADRPENEVRARPGSSLRRASRTQNDGAIQASGHRPRGGNAAQSNTAPKSAGPNVEFL